MSNQNEEEENVTRFPLKRLGAELILAGITFGIGFFVWVTVSIYSVQAKADRVTAIESKIDYIYTYLLEKDKK